jgi:hypothetical protein
MDRFSPTSLNAAGKVHRPDDHHPDPRSAAACLSYRTRPNSINDPVLAHVHFVDFCERSSKENGRRDLPFNESRWPSINDDAKVRRACA